MGWPVISENFHFWGDTLVVQKSKVQARDQGTHSVC